jgi:phosphogluconate dehydratase
VFDSQGEVQDAFKRGKLDRNVVIVVRGQGPRANGMPELHKLMPLLGALQDRGFEVALVTDGRMSGASGKVLAAIHVTPEAAEGGPLAKVRNGDVLRVDANEGVLDVVSPANWRERAPAQLDLAANNRGLGRELFTLFRAHACSAEHGGTAFPDYDPV